MDRKRTSSKIAFSKRWQIVGTLVQVLLPSIKMKTSFKPRFDREFHDFLTNQFGGYTAASGNITGYWVQKRSEECNEHREYQIAISNAEDFSKLGDYLEGLAWRLKEKTIFCVVDGSAFLIPPRRQRKGQR